MKRIFLVFEATTTHVVRTYQVLAESEVEAGENYKTGLLADIDEDEDTDVEEVKQFTEKQYELTDDPDDSVDGFCDSGGVHITNPWYSRDFITSLGEWADVVEEYGSMAEAFLQRHPTSEADQKDNCSACYVVKSR